jgi:hypothetical protein
MNRFWLLLLVPQLCAARIVQVDDLVKKHSSHAPGTVVHETTSYMIAPSDAWLPSGYKIGPAFRYRFAGVEREGKRVYIKLRVENLFLERFIARNQSAQHNSKTGSASSTRRTQSTEFELLLPVENGRAIFPFPTRIVSDPHSEHVPVSEAVLEVVSGRLRVLEVAGKVYPATKLPWSPPREWPRENETVYVGARPETEPAQPPPSDVLKMPGAP